MPDSEECPLLVLAADDSVACRIVDLGNPTNIDGDAVLRTAFKNADSAHTGFAAFNHLRVCQSTGVN